MEQCFNFFKTSMGIVRHRVKPNLKEGMQEWLDHL
jgi:hypothetical protein